ncbi:period circadian protein homolog 3 isoform X2 [Sphaerodactylus townsendi]|uniref:period circadian protein homolog 3 isoform X2 n=1 Tax=Sphaerodactylus townsendi TaxID=933632 RepID=UPI002026103A|nr:period circadian protein homolog 3 isoform X2 [Sphaerodactylus townsendi]
MNVNLLRNDFLDHQPVTEAGKQQADGLEDRDDTQRKDADVFCGSSGNDFNGLAFTKASSHGLESHSRSVRSASVQRKSHSRNKSEQRNRNQSHEELTMMIREMKRHLPRESCTKTSTLNALNYALKCVQQVQNSKAVRFGGDRGSYQTDASVYSIGELAAVTSEHTPKNTDTFVAVFSLLSGKMMHVSEQAASILNCKKKLLESSRFAELLAPQDISIFYTHTNPSLLPLWNTKAQTASVYEYAQVKSFFCRIRVGKDQGKLYWPFRITPYLVNVCYQNQREPEPCCLAVAEKNHSGYEAPRIPLEKRIFTTAHTPDCAFLEIDDRAVPLLGYLPQDLIGTSILKHLHPEDRPLMVAIHRKVLKFAGQPPFEHSPIRFCTQNGDYVILDTSWSSFVNPWSRKVAFIIGRHKVRTSPLNEDVFAPRSRERNGVDKEIRELQGQIYRLLLQPVHNNGSSGYGSLVSNGSYEHYISVASSSDSSWNCAEEIQKEPKAFVDINRLKNVGQQLYIESHSKHLKERGRSSDGELLRGKQHTTPGLSSVSTGDAPVAHCDDSSEAHCTLSYQQINYMDGIIRYLESWSVPALKRKSESTNISSSSSEDDKLVQLIQKEAQALEDTPGLSSIASQPSVTPVPEGATEPPESAAVASPPMTGLALPTKALSVVSITSQCSYSSTLVHVPHPESEVAATEEAALQNEQTELPPPSAPAAAPEEIRLVGLTKKVLSAHTQKEEQNYMDQFRQKVLLPHYRSYFQQGQVGSNCTGSHNQGDFASKKTSPENCKRNKQGTFKHPKLPESSSKNCSYKSGNCGERTAAQKPSCALSEGSWPGPSSVIHHADPYFMPGFPLATSGGDHTWPSGGAVPFVPSLVPTQPVLAFPTPCMAGFTTVLLHNFPVLTPLPQPSFQAQETSPSRPYNSVMPPCSPPTMPSAAAPDPLEPISPPAMFSSAEEEQQEPGDEQPQLFSNSRSSSPLQLDLLQEEMPKPLELPCVVPAKIHVETKRDQDGEDSGNDGHSGSSELYDLLLHGDSHSGTESAASGSGSAESSSLAFGSSGSSSNGTSAGGAGSRNSSKYFASNDSSEVSKRGKKNQEEGESCQPARIKEEVLKGDLEKLAAMTKQQPHFTQGQKEELAEVHPWILTQTIPQEINTQLFIFEENGVPDGFPMALPFYQGKPGLLEIWQDADRNRRMT